MSEVAKFLEGLSPSKRALYQTLLEEKRAAGEGAAPAPPPPTIVPDPAGRYEPFPLTDMQQAYWVGRSGALKFGNVATHIYEELESADIDLGRVNRAWQRLVERHDMLRAVVLPDGRQQILREVPAYQIAVTDLRGQGEAAVATHLEEVRYEMSHQALPSDRWPLFDLRATRLGERHYRVHISIDGLMLDGWSYQRLFHEWFQLYEDPERALTPFEISFRDYVLAETALRDTESYQRALAYWQGRLPTLPPAPQLPLAQAPELLSEPRFVRRKFRLEAEPWGRLKARAAQAGLTAPSLLLAAYAEVLTAWSKSPRFTLNVPRFNRLPLHPEVNELLGEFASFTLLEVDNSAPDPFEARARRIQDQLWRDLDYHQVSGVRILRELNQLQKQGAEARMPIVFTNLPHAVDAKQLPVSFSMADKSIYGVTQTSQVWLDYQGAEDAGAFLFNWDAVDDLFPPDLIADMFDAFCGFLRRLADDERTWQEVRPQLVPAGQLEQRALINAAQAPIPEVLLHTLFEEQARARPEDPAVLTSSRSLTYGELSRHSNRLGRRLRGLGVSPNELVAVVMEKGWEQVVAALGTLAAGGAYLPIDPSVPPERLHYLLDNGQVGVVLTQTRLDGQLEWPEHVRRVCVDDEESLEGDGGGPLAPAQGPDDLAYVIYTSGSTGLPKGVMISHRGVVNAVLETNRRFAVGPSDRAFAITALHHDMSVYDIFGVLGAGGAVVIPDAAGTRDPGHWAELMRRERVTVWNSVPALMEMLVEHADGRPGLLPDSLRLVFLGGDWIPLTLPSRIRALTVADEVQVVSVGGPTETTLWNIWYVIEQPDPTWKSVPYGRPIANTRYYVLNELGEHCPVWVPGVLYCAGVGVARGYWRDEERTAASFRHHERLGERLYRTGDLGRFLPDGNIEFLGREDAQVKIQGMRIELGEVEAALAQHPRARTAVVVVGGGAEGGRHLAAHVVLADAGQEDPAGAGDFLDEEAAEQSDGVLLDKAARIEFKLREHGLRQFGEEHQAVELDKPPADEALLAAYAARRSYRAFKAEPVPLGAMSALLGCLRQVSFEGVPVPKYLYPSSGGLYPVQAYLHVKAGGVEGVAPGTYYYSPKEHRLVLLEPDAPLDRSLHVSINKPVFDRASFSLFLVADMDAITPMYDKLARDFCLLEAGYIGQTLMQAAPRCEVGLCPVGSIDFEPLRTSFRLGPRHVLLHSLLGGRIEAAQTLPEAFRQEVASPSAAGRPQEPADGRQALRQEFQDFLRRKLPPHMVPSSFAFHDALPLTPNGKVDRAALAQSSDYEPAEERPYAPPRTELERLITEVWRSVLPAERIGIHDNFFELSGNSVQLVQAHAILEKRLDRRLSVVDLFQYPTIAALAEMLSTTGAPQTSLDETFERAERRARTRRQPRPSAPKPEAGEEDESAGE